MKTALKAKWVEALRSGEFKQGRGALREENDKTGKTEYCCLGVLCAISPAVSKRQSGGNGYLTDESLAYAGFDNDIQHTLASLNDDGDLDGTGKSWGFKRIATYIEKNL